MLFTIDPCYGNIKIKSFNKNPVMLMGARKKIGPTKKPLKARMCS